MKLPLPAELVPPLRSAELEGIKVELADAPFGHQPSSIRSSGRQRGGVQALGCSDLGGLKVEMTWPDR